MQNFTLGKKGISMLLLAFILLTSSFSAQAQNCPTVADTTQDFCYLATVSDLEATANGDPVRWYRTATSTNPIPENELLQTLTYYAGNASGTCTTRVAVSVTVDNAGAPEPQFGNIFAPCVYGSTGADVKTVQDLIDNIVGNQVEIYDQQFSGSPLAPGTPLGIGQSYYAGQRNATTNCPTSRVALRYDPVFAPAPTAEPVQSFCEGSATVGDLQAQATSEYTQGFRWYSTATSQPPLANSTELINGETYYVSQIVNRDDRNEPPCESRERFAVTVVVDDSIAGEDNTSLTFCRSALPEIVEAAEVEAFFRSLLSANANANGTFSNSTIAELTTQFNTGEGTGVFSTTYTVGEGECVNSATLSVTVLASPEAGEDNTATTFCRAELPETLSAEEVDAFLRSLLSGADTGGTFSPDAQTIANNFNSGSGVGVFSTTYTVTVDGCSDSAFISVAVTDPNAGENITAPDFCRSALPASLTEDAVRDFFLSLLTPGATLDGTFSNQSIAEITADFNARTTFPVTYTTTYTVGEGNCESTATISVTVNDVEEANAGNFDGQTYCSNDGMIDLTTLTNLDAAAISGGVFSGTGVVNNQFDTSVGEGTYEITYTVSETSECGEGTGSTTFIITVEGAPFSGNVSDTLCVTEARLLITDPTSASAYLAGLLTGIDIEFNAGNFTEDAQAEGLRLFNYIQNTPSDSDSEEFNFTYIDPSVTDFCEDGVISISITIENTQEATTEPISDIEVCSSDVALDLNTLIGNNFPGGTFTIGETVITGGLLNVSNLGVFTITYTVSAEDEDTCLSDSSSTEFTVTVSNSAANAGADNTDTVFCRSDLQDTFTADEVEAFFRSLLSPDAQPGGTFSPDFATIANNFNNGTGIGVFSTTYTVGAGDCQDSATLSATVNETVVADAGTIANTTLCASEEAFNLNNLLTGGNTPNGTFTMGTTVITNGLLNVSQDGVYTITYTVSEDNEACVTGSASTTFTVTVTNDANAGSDNTATVFCRSDLQDTFTADEVEAFFRSLLSADAQPGGTFSPDFATIAATFNNGTGIGVFSTTYTVGEGDCQDSATLSATVNETVVANAGTIANATVCASEEAFNLNNLLTSGNTPNGTFSLGSTVITGGLFNVSNEGVYTITYTVSESDEATCVTGSASTQFTVTVNEGDVFVGTPSTGVVCVADVATTFPTVEAATNYLLNLLDADVSRDGEFGTPIVQFFNQLTGTGDFTITYTVSEGDCQASVDLTVRIVESAFAGTDGSVTLNENDAPVNLFNYLGGNPTAGGTWSPGNGMFNPATDAPGVYTYTVGSESCRDSATVTVTVTQDPITTCEGLAGADNSIEVCNSDVRNLNETSVRTLYLGLLEDGVPTNGTFNPSISALINQYNLVSNYGDFTTTYTVVDGDCSDSAVLTVTVIEANDAGADMNLTFCSTDAAVNLFDFLSPFATTNGTFTGYANGTFNPSTATVGVTTITYVVEDDNSECSEDNFTSTFTITVLAPQAANAGGNQTVTYCVDQNQNIQLTTLLGQGAITTGSFGAPYANGVFNPSTAGVGVYPITYTVGGSECVTGTATATITITVVGTAAAPVAAANQSFCLVDNPTVANLVATGAGTLTWYSNAALTTVAPATTALTNNAVFYVVSSTGTSACETSSPVMVTVTLNTEVSPTVQPDGNEFCRQDNPTVQDLIANLNGTAIRIYTSSTGGTALATTVALQDNVTYYATSTNATTGCESSERRAINVEVGFCGIPEGFSPNGDGINDRFVIPDIAEDYPNYTIEVFNRWGNVVFKGNANTPDWDGVSNQSATLGDKVLPTGVYFYIVNYNDGSTPPVQGKLYLSR